MESYVRAEQRGTVGWQAILEGSSAQRAVEVARSIASHYRDQAEVDSLVAAARQQSTTEYATYWLPYGMAQGWSGLALLCGYLDACFPGESWDQVGHRF